jgi:RNA polymerase sigma-70 factor (ECF subfamily)
MNKVLHQDPLFFVDPYIKDSVSTSSPAGSCEDKLFNNYSIDSLFRDHWLDVCRLLHKNYGSGPPEPEDVAQEAFSQFAQMKNVTEVQNPKAYIIKIAVNITLKSMGKLRKIRELITQQLHLDEDHLNEICPEIILQDEQRVAAMQNGIKKLSSKQRDILMCVRIKGQTYAQISIQTGWSLADICRQLNEAMAILESIDEQARGIHFGNIDTNIHPALPLSRSNTNEKKS